MDLAKIFTQIGFTAYHARIYSALLQSGPLTMQAISKNTKIPRSSCYEYLPELIDSGLIEELVEGKGKLYKAANPEKFISWHQTKLEEYRFEQEKLMTLKPELLSLYDDQQDRPWATQFKGTKQIGLMLEKLLDSESEVLLIDCFNLENNVGFKFDDRFYKNLTMALKQKHIHTRELIPATNNGLNYREFNTNKLQNIKLYDPEQFKAGIKKIIWEKNILFLSMRENRGLLVHHESIADLERLQFENLWLKAGL